jgi:Zn-dependent peptidase ImmA (M78 family)/predicted secreted protein
VAARVDVRWEQAHQLAQLKAAHVHKDFAVDPTQRVDVFAIIRQANLLLGFEPLPKLSGAYFASERAILINAHHPLARQRYTAGHEFGHFAFGHKSSVDPLTDPLARWGGSSYWSEEEKQAEAFSAWFLMPKTLVNASLEQLGLERPTLSEDVYALALRMGTSYEATARHLPNLRLASPHDVKQWLKTPPAKIKLALSAGAPPENLRNDVWPLDERDNDSRIAVRTGDRLAIELEDVPSSGYVWEPEVRDDIRVVLDSVRDGLDHGRQTSLHNDEDAEGAGARHVFVLEVSPHAEPGEDELIFRRVRPWNSKVSRTFRLALEIQAPQFGFAEEQMVIAA